MLSPPIQSKSRPLTLPEMQWWCSLRLPQFSKPIREGNSSFPYIYDRSEAKRSTEQEGTVASSSTTCFKWVTVQRTGCVQGTKLLAWVRITQLSTRGRSQSTDLQNSQPEALCSPTCVLNSFFLQQHQELWTPCALPSPSSNTAIFRRGQRLVWWKDEALLPNSEPKATTLWGTIWTLASEERNSFWLLLHPETSRNCILWWSKILQAWIYTKPQAFNGNENWFNCLNPQAPC